MQRHIKTFILLSFAFLSPVRGGDVKSVGAIINSDWKWLRLGYAVHPGCIGILFPTSLFITRSDSGFRIYHVTTDEYGTDYYSKGRNLPNTEYFQIITAFLRHHIKAIEETSTSEFFSRLPESRREIELEKYFKTHGRPIGGFSDHFAFVWVSPGGFEDLRLEAYSSGDSASALANWINDYPVEEQR